MKSISIFLIVPLLTLSACAPSTDMIQHGNEMIQLTQTYKFFGSNVVERTKCVNGELVNGFCPPDRHPSSAGAITQGPGTEVAKMAILGGAILGGAAILSQANASRMTSSVTQNASPFSDSHISTQYLNGQVPPWLLK